MSFSLYFGLSLDHSCRLSLLLNECAGWRVRQYWGWQVYSEVEDWGICKLGQLKEELTAAFGDHVSACKPLCMPSDTGG